MSRLKVLFGVYPWAFNCPGGGERQLIAYRNHLTELGVEVSLYNQWEPNIKDYDIFHFFSVMPGSFQLCEYIKNQGLKLFISPNLWVTEETKYNYPHDEIKKLLHIADKIVVNSHIEALELSKVYELPLNVFAVVYNGVEKDFFHMAPKNDFVETYNLQNTKYILNIANIEPRKNQLIFLKALKNFPDYKLVVIGHVRDDQYYQECISEAEDQLVFIGSLEYNSKLLHSAIGGCEFFAMPSTLETPSIAALEAAASSKKILITQEGSTKEYFKEFATYIDPTDIESMKSGIEDTIAKTSDKTLSNHIEKHFSWDIVCKSLQSCYKKTMNGEESMQRKPIVYFDCTSTIRSNLNTGVQRVVRELLQMKEIFEEKIGLTFQPICHQYSWYYKLDDALAMTEETEKNFPRIEPVYNDIYFCADSYWSYNITEWLPYFKHLGVKIVTTFYDMIPLKHAELYNHEITQNFKNTTNEIIKYSDLLLCISQQSKNDLLEYLNDNGNTDKIENVKSFNLAPGSLKNLEIDQTFKTKYEKKEYMLMVGTIEPRKGYYRTLYEFQLLWEKGANLALIIVGKHGTNDDKILKKINELISLRYPLEVLTDVNDTQLNTLYQHSKAIIVSSIAEGYGLSLAEAMQYNKPIFANRLMVFGEFAGAYPIYFDINKKNDLSSKIEDFDNFEWFDTPPELTTWQDTAKEISTYIIDELDIEQYSQIKLSNIAVQWAYKLYFNKDVDDNTIQMWLEKCKTLDELIEHLVYIKVNSNTLTRESVQWAYKLFLDQDVDEDSLTFWLSKNSLSVLVDHLKYELISKKD